MALARQAFCKFFSVTAMLLLGLLGLLGLPVLAKAEMAAPPPPLVLAEIKGVPFEAVRVATLAAWKDAGFTLVPQQATPPRNEKGYGSASIATQLPLKQWGIAVQDDITLSAVLPRGGICQPCVISDTPKAEAAKWLALQDRRTINTSVQAARSQAYRNLSQRMAKLRASVALTAVPVTDLFADLERATTGWYSRETPAAWNHVQGIPLSKLRQTITQAFVDAGFEVDGTANNAPFIAFKFPYRSGYFLPAKYPLGYRISLFARDDAQGLCRNCNFSAEPIRANGFNSSTTKSEKVEINRLFNQALDKVNRQLKQGLAPYIEPGSTFQPVPGGDYSKDYVPPPMVVT